MSVLVKRTIKPAVKKGFGLSEKMIYLPNAHSWPFMR